MKKRKSHAKEEILAAIARPRTIKGDLIAFYRRYDVLFSFGGVLIGSFLLYADRMPWWGLAALVTVREAFGFIGMLAQKNGNES